METSVYLACDDLLLCVSMSPISAAGVGGR